MSPIPKRERVGAIRGDAGLVHRSSHIVTLIKVGSTGTGDVHALLPLNTTRKRKPIGRPIRPIPGNRIRRPTQVVITPSIYWARSEVQQPDRPARPPGRDEVRAIW